MKKTLVVLLLLVVAGMVVVWCSKKNNNTDSTGTAGQNQDVVENGDVVKVDYVGSTQEDGVFDTSLEEVAKTEELYNEIRTYEPLEFEVGAGNMIPGFEKGVIGMKVGESKTITIPAEEGYGEIKPELVQELPVSNFAEAGIDPQVGETYNFGIAQGKVLEINAETVKIDFNHFLAGKTLTFEVTIKEIIKANMVDNTVEDSTDPVPTQETMPTEEVPAADDMGAQAE